MTAFLDASIVLAAADRADLNHGRAAAWFRTFDQPLAISATTLGELDVVLERALGAEASEAFLAAVDSGAVDVVAPTRHDLRRASQLRRAAGDQRPSLADALTVAIAERMGATVIATLDRRPYAIMRPHARSALVLEP